MKAKLRREMKAALAAMPPDRVAQKSHAACSALARLEEFHAADAVMLYMPIRGEVDSTPLALAAWQQDKTVVLPRVSWQQPHLIPVRCRSLDDEQMVEGRYGIREPADGEPWPYADIDLIVLPALAFDRGGNRLGRGGGFYDRFLAEPGVRAFLCGLGFAEQVVDGLPARSHDQPLDALVTDQEVLRFDRQTQA